MQKQAKTDVSKPTLTLVSCPNPRSQVKVEIY